MRPNLFKLLNLYGASGATAFTIGQFVKSIGKVLSNSRHVRKPDPIDSNASASAQKVIPFVLSYRSGLPRAFAKALRIAPLPGVYNVRIVPSWCNSLPTVTSYVRQANKQAITRVGNGGFVTAVAGSETNQTSLGVHRTSGTSYSFPGNVDTQVSHVNLSLCSIDDFLLRNQLK